MTWKPLKPLALEKLISAVNICELLDEDDLTAIGRRAMEGYEQDVEARRDWERRQAMANKLALQVVESRTEPWPNASNIKFPLITVAAMQFQARAYPALFSGTDLVKCKVIGEDIKGEKTSRAERIATHMTWQNLEQDPDWEEDKDKLCLVTALAGCAFTKKAFDPGAGRQKTKLVLPRHFVINYWSRSIEGSPRYTETFYLQANDIRQSEIDKRFRVLKSDEDTKGEDYEKSRDGPVRPESNAGEDEIEAAKDQRQGITKPRQDDVTPWFTGEQYCWIDLDGDGYEEPYIITLDLASGMVRRIVARYLPSGVKFKTGDTLTKYAVHSTEGTEYPIPKGSVIYKISAVRVFTKYSFVPSPDGGFYDLGLGSLEGPINVSVNDLINMMVDAGTMITLGGGFLGRAFKGRGGPMTFAPGQWYALDNAGDDIRKSMLPRPDPQPPQFLFQLLGMLVQYAERIVSANDIQSGEQEVQNQKAETTRILNENGSRVYNGIFKRMWRAAKGEYGIQYELNALYLPDDVDFERLTSGSSALIQKDDYDGSTIDVRPAADPHIVSDAEAQKQAAMLIQLAGSQPGFNRYRTTLRLLKAQKVPNIEEIYPPPMTKGPDGQPQPAPDYPPPPNPKLMLAEVKQQELQLKEGDLKLKQQKMQSEMMQAKMDAQQEAQESIARIHKLEAEALLLSQQAKTEATEPLMKMIYAQIEAEGKNKDRLLKFVDTMTDHVEKMNGSTGGGDTSDAGMAGAQGQPAVSRVPSMAGANGAGAHGVMGQPGI